MYRAMHISRRVGNPVGGVVKVGRVRAIRRFATGADAKPVAASVPSAPLPKKKKRVLRRLVLYTGGLAAVFYAGSTFVAFNNERYHDFFYESAPFGENILEYVEEQGWDAYLKTGLFESGTERVKQLENAVSKTIHSETFSKVINQAGKAKDVVVEKTHALKAAAEEKLGSQPTQSVVVKKVTVVEKKEKVKSAAAAAAAAAASKAKETAATTKAQTREVVEESKPTRIKFSPGVEDLVRQAEAALAAESSAHSTDASPKTFETADAPSDSAASPAKNAEPARGDENVYTADLPLGFEPPPGFTRPKPAKAAPALAKSESESAPKPDLLPLVSPAVAELTSSEPVIAHLASTIDNLASFLNSNPAAARQARDVLDTAKVDLTQLATRIEGAKAEEREKLETKLDEQVRAYTVKLLELEMEAQDKLDGQEQEFRQFFEEDRRKLVQAYRTKLDNELRTQSEIINERLKEEVIAQGIEMQRRWIREIKVRVEQERGGRLAKLDELAANLKRLERIALDNSNYLDENLRLHALWSALRAVHAAVESPERQPFRDELRVLRHIAAAREDPVIASVLDTLEATDVPDVGVEPLPALSTWFSSSVAPQVARVALVPEDNAGVSSHIASHVISAFRFQRQGLVEGKDVLSVLARAEHYMNEKDLDSATRELNQLKGTPKALLGDWLAAARRRLEVLQAIEVVQAQATLASLLVI